MEDYNRLISARVLDGYDEMIDTVPQPQMLGGKRMRSYVLPASTEYDFPATLAVGRMDGRHPATLGGDFWNDFGDGFPAGELQGSGYSGGAVFRGADGKIYSTGQIHPKRGGKKFNIGKALKSVGHALEPVAKDVGKQLVKEGVKQGVKALTSGGRRKKINVIGALKSVGKVVAPVAKEIFHDVVLPEGKKALKQYISSSLKPPAGGKRGRPRKVMGGDPSTYTPQRLLAEGGRRCYSSSEESESESDEEEGGALIRNAPRQFHSSVYPPALASYSHSFPMGHDAHGRGRGKAKLPKSGAKRNSARGAIVAEVMKKHGLNLAQASKFVKEKGLY